MFNKENIIKYLILFTIVTLSTYMIPNCSIMNEHAMYIGLLASTTFVLLDIYTNIKYVIYVLLYCILPTH